MDELFNEIENKIKNYESKQSAFVSDDKKQEIISKAYKDALYQFYKTLFVREFVQDFMVDECLPVVPNQQAFVDYCEKAKSRNSTKPPFMMVTVNPYLDTPLDDLVVKVNKFVNRVCVSAFLYAYEVRKEDLSGLHVHILIKYTCKPYDLKRNAKSTFKSICNVNDDRILNFKFINPDILPDKIEYLKGTKKESKMDAVAYSIQYRQQNNLDPYYTSPPPLPCRGAEKQIDNEID